MEKKFLGLIALFFFIPFIFLASGCSSESSDSDDCQTSAEITFVSENGEKIGSQKVYNTYVLELVRFNYSKRGYVCTFFDENKNEVFSGSFTTEKDCRITVKTKPVSYTIKFAKSSDYRTVTGAFPSDISCVYDKEYTLPSNNLTCSSYGTTYKARGWTKSQTSYSKKGEYADGSKVKNLASTDGATVTLYPCFTNDECYMLKFYTSDSSYASYDTVYADAGDVIPAAQLPSASKIGCRHDGYYLDGDSTQTVIDFSKYSVTGDATFRPKFSNATYKAAFVTEHGTAPEPVTWKYSSSYSDGLDISTGIYVLESTGYKFNGWYEEGDIFSTTKIYYKTTYDMTLNAKWTPWTVSVSYEKNAPKGITVNGFMNASSFDYATAKNFASNAYYASGYKFAGWNTKADGSGTSYAECASFTWKGEKNNETVSLYAQWEKIQVGMTVSILSPSNSSDVTLTYDSDSQSFKANLNESVIYKWFVDGLEVENETGASLSVYLLSEGQHSVMATSKLNGRTYGSTMVVSVAKGE